MFFFLICAWRDGWTNDPDAGNLRHQHAHYNVTVIVKQDCCPVLCPQIPILKHTLPQGRACCFNCHITSGLKIKIKETEAHYFHTLLFHSALLFLDITHRWCHKIDTIFNRSTFMIQRCGQASVSLSVFNNHLHRSVQGSLNCCQIYGLPSRNQNTNKHEFIQKIEIGPTPW